jgi:DNA-cytosine methyltransferase
VAVDVMAAVERRIGELALSEREAARQIGVTLTSLQRHLRGEYARSDSLAKYRRWLRPREADKATREASVTPVESHMPYGPAHLAAPAPPAAGWRIVDLFSGCGGLSLGFELADDGAFRLVLAADNSDAALSALERNRTTSTNPGRRVDLSSFVSEAEVLAYYLDHVARIERDERLIAALEAPSLGLGAVRATLAAVDAAYLADLEDLRASRLWREAVGQLDPVVIRQTAVLGFHDGLSLPQPAGRAVDIELLPWAHGSATEHRAGVACSPEALRSADREYSEAYEALMAKVGVSGARGQLASSSNRITAFVEFLGSDAAECQRAIWREWRGARSHVRAEYFRDATVADALRRLYEPYRVSVLLGGPPCQGFSRIGRGKIRSLREHGVHVQTDSAAGDKRNRLMEAYVQWVGALEPDVFLFENVRHFQAKVVTPQGTFHATDVLEEAIESLSGGNLKYEVSSSVLDASQHSIPQTRERFFMVGVRHATDCFGDVDLARWSLDLPRSEPVPLRVAIDGLGSVRWARGAGSLAAVTPAARPAAAGGPAAVLAAWLAGEPPRWSQAKPGVTDAHVARPPRPDDQAWFGLMGPGRRWMDYRTDDSETLRQLTSLLETLGRLESADLERLDLTAEAVAGLAERIDGSLPIRLLLEAIKPDDAEEDHHLLTATYLSKREGNHGDWLARLAADRPAKTIVSHMAKDTYAYVHPWEERTLSVREAARIQTFPDWFSFGQMSLVDAFRAIGNAVPPLLSAQLASRVSQVLTTLEEARSATDRASVVQATG